MKEVGKGLNEINKTKEEIKKELKVDEMDIVKNIRNVKEVIKK